MHSENGTDEEGLQGGREGGRKGGREGGRAYLSQALKGVVGHGGAALVFLPGQVTEVVDEEGDGLFLDGKGEFLGEGREEGKEGGREGGGGWEGHFFLNSQVEKYGCQNDGLDEADTMVSMGRKEGGREEGREEGREDVPGSSAGGR